MLVRTGETCSVCLISSKLPGTLIKGAVGLPPFKSTPCHSQFGNWVASQIAHICSWRMCFCATSLAPEVPDWLIFSYLTEINKLIFMGKKANNRNRKIPRTYSNLLNWVFYVNSEFPYHLGVHGNFWVKFYLHGRMGFYRYLEVLRPVSTHLP